MSKAKDFLSEAVTTWRDNTGMKNALKKVLSVMDEAVDELKNYTEVMISNEGKSADEVIRDTANFCTTLEHNLNLRMKSINKAFNKK